MNFSRREVESIRLVLRRNQEDVQANPLWVGLCEKCDVGDIGPRVIKLSATHRERLRCAVIRNYGFDPLHVEPAGDRVETAAIIKDEKLFSESVFGDQLILASPNGNTIFTINGPANTPSGSLLSLRPDTLETDQIDTIVIVENGSLMIHWDRWANVTWLDKALLLYRGHGKNAETVLSLVDLLRERANIIVFTDFDPSGFDIALRFHPNALILPSEWQEWRAGHSFVKRFNKIDNYFSQVSSLGADWLQKYPILKSNDTLSALLAHIEQEKLAITQEHIIANNKSLFLLNC